MGDLGVKVQHFPLTLLVVLTTLTLPCERDDGREAATNSAKANLCKEYAAVSRLPKLSLQMLELIWKPDEPYRLHVGVVIVATPTEAATSSALLTWLGIRKASGL